MMTAVQVYLLDNSFETINIDSEWSAFDVSFALADRYGIDPSVRSLFACYLTEDCDIGRCLGDDERPVHVFGRINQAPKLVYQARLFVPSLAKCKNPTVIHLRFIQAVHTVVHEIYPTASSLASTLSRISEEAQSLANNSIRLKQSVGAKLQYLQLVSKLDVYGCAFFPVQLDSNHVLLAVNQKGLYNLKADTRQIVRFYPLNRLQLFGHKSNAEFFFKFEERVHSYITHHGSAICGLLDDYAVDMLRHIQKTEGVASSTTRSATNIKLGHVDVSAIRVQALFRGYRLRCELDNQFCAIQLQALFRGYRLRRDLDTRFAAIQIQAGFRGYRQRCAFDDLITEMEVALMQ
jgi:hypothetical protein